MTDTAPSWIRSLIHAYLHSAASLAGRLAEEYGVPNLLAGRQTRTIPRTGKAANGIEFRFHGAGCRMTDGSIVVDLDFGRNGAVDVFDAWRLHVYSEDQPEVAGARSHAEISDALGVLLRDNELVVVTGSNRFRLPDEAFGGTPELVE